MASLSFAPLLPPPGTSVVHLVTPEGVPELAPDQGQWELYGAVQQVIQVRHADSGGQQRRRS